MKSAECPLRCQVSLILIPESSPAPIEPVSNLTPESDWAPGVVRPSRRAPGGSASVPPPAAPGWSTDDGGAPPVVVDGVVVSEPGFFRFVLFGRRLAVALSTLTEAAATVVPAPPDSFNDDSYNTPAFLTRILTTICTICFHFPPTAH